MKLAIAACTTVIFALLGAAAIAWAQQAGPPQSAALPPPQLSGGMPLSEALATRRSIRQFAPAPLTPPEVGQLCWAAQGITDARQGKRTAPSAGALYPIELFLVTATGVQHYNPQAHALEPHLAGDLRADLSGAALSQQTISDAPACFVIAGVVERTAVKYGPRAERYCFIEAGHVAQNILLQATALKLAGVPMGAFDDAEVAKALKLPPGFQPLYLVGIGHAPQ
jgi:SagB-type dehydrogenase family enzyme